MALSSCKLTEVIQVCGKLCSTSVGNTMKKFTSMESQRNSRMLVISAVKGVPAMSKVSLSPRPMPKRSATPSSTDTSAFAGVSSNQLPTATVLCVGKVSAKLKFSSRSTVLRARSSVKVSAVMVSPLMALKRPRTMGYKLTGLWLAVFNVC